MLKLTKTSNSEGQGGLNKNKHVMSFSLNNKSVGKKTYTEGTNGNKTSVKNEKTQPITVKTTENRAPPRGRGSGAEVF